LPRVRAGTSLIELLVALVLLDLLAITALHSVLTTQRIARTAAAGTATDLARLEAFRAAAADPTCRAASSATLRTLSFGAAPTRPAVTVVVRCGR
jgi:Tfp pilus assembly protein PilX